MARSIGIDLHRRRFTACTLAANGRFYQRTWSLAQLDRFVAWLRPSDQVAVEMSGTTRRFYEAVQPHVARVAVVDPHQFKVISQSVKKTDRHDAQQLALFLSKDLLPEVRMKDKQHAQLASLTQTRDQLVKQRTALKNKINNVLAAQGMVLPREALSSVKRLDEIADQPFDALIRTELGVLVAQIKSLNASIAQLEDTIKKEGQRLKGFANLDSIKGIGPISATILLTIIDNIHDFASEGKLAAYFGIVPRVDQSDRVERHGRITKRGTKLGRTTLVQCALVAKRYSPYLAAYYERIRARRGGGKAIIALARKFLGIIYRTLKFDWVFEDFPHFVLVR